MPTHKSVYLDTSLWNELCDLQVSADQLINALSKTGLEIVLGTHVVYELAKTFKSRKKDAAIRGRQLFEYLHTFVARDIPCVRMTQQLLIDEIKVSENEINTVEIFYGTSETGGLSEEVRKLSRGEFDSRANSFITHKMNQVDTLRHDAKEWFKDHNIPSSYRDLSFDGFCRKLIHKMGREMLGIEINRRFQDLQQRHRTRIAKNLLRQTRKYPLSNALVRAHLYTNWRILKGGSLSRDVLDDSYHIVNAAYCDVFASKESLHNDYGPKILTNVRVYVWDHATHLQEWLVRLS